MNLCVHSVCLTHSHPPMHMHTRTGLGLEEEVPDYDLDSEDEEWLNAQTDEWVRHTGSRASLIWWCMLVLSVIWVSGSGEDSTRISNEL